mmetsp:Transcript_60186/g.172890  ORF Transcript_60186/g.172890 Transcript_60186/m.172890 type:complete len:210 (+) Transcript_60186:283-912(+)
MSQQVMQGTKASLRHQWYELNKHQPPPLGKHIPIYHTLRLLGPRSFIQRPRRQPGRAQRQPLVSVQAHASWVASLCRQLGLRKLILEAQRWALGRRRRRHRGGEGTQEPQVHHHSVGVEHGRGVLRERVQELGRYRHGPGHLQKAGGPSTLRRLECGDDDGAAVNGLRGWERLIAQIPAEHLNQVQNGPRPATTRGPRPRTLRRRRQGG